MAATLWVQKAEREGACSGAASLQPDAADVAVDAGSLGRTEEAREEDELKA